MIRYTGCQLNDGLITSCALLFTSAYQMLRQCICVIFAFQCHRYRVASASGQLLTATYGISAQEQKKHIWPTCFCGAWTIWNTLPATVRDPLLTYGQFCSKLKSVMFNRADLNSCAYVITIRYKASAITTFCLLTYLLMAYFAQASIGCAK